MGAVTEDTALCVDLDCAKTTLRDSPSTLPPTLRRSRKHGQESASDQRSLTHHPPHGRQIPIPVFGRTLFSAITLSCTSNAGSTACTAHFLNLRYAVAHTPRNCQAKYCTVTSLSLEGFVIHLAGGHMPMCTWIESIANRHRRQNYCTYYVAGRCCSCYATCGEQHPPASSCFDSAITGDALCLPPARRTVLYAYLILKCSAAQCRRGNTRVVPLRRRWNGNVRIFS